MVINRDDAQVEAMVPAPVLVKQGRGRAARSQGRKVTRFGLDAPDRPATSVWSTKRHGLAGARP